MGETIPDTKHLEKTWVLGIERRIRQRLGLSFILKRREELRGQGAPCIPVRAGEPPGKAVCQLLATTGWLPISCLSFQYGVEWAEREPCLWKPGCSYFLYSLCLFPLCFPFKLSQVSVRGPASLICANMNHTRAPASNGAADPGTSLQGPLGA